MGIGGVLDGTRLGMSWRRILIVHAMVRLAEPAVTVLLFFMDLDLTIVDLKKHRSACSLIENGMTCGSCISKNSAQNPNENRAILGSFSVEELCAGRVLAT